MVREIWEVMVKEGREGKVRKVRRGRVGKEL